LACQTALLQARRRHYYGRDSEEGSDPRAAGAPARKPIPMGSEVGGPELVGGPDGAAGPLSATIKHCVAKVAGQPEASLESCGGAGRRRRAAAAGGSGGGESCGGAAQAAIDGTAPKEDGAASPKMNRPLPGEEGMERSICKHLL